MLKIQKQTYNLSTIKIKTLFLAVLFLTPFSIGHAASLSLSPGTGVYSSGSTFTVRVAVNTDGKPINAADGTISFSPNELSVVSVTRSSSIFNLWVTEPTFSNSAGTISFSGGLPSGYTGNSGTIMSITFRASGAGPTKTRFNSASVLANDGMGTNILTSMNGGTYTIQAKTQAPEPEVIEYIAPANTPSAPSITSNTHPDPSNWYKTKKAVLSWALPSGVNSVRTLLNKDPTSVPTKVYEDPIQGLTLEDLPEGISYLHVQFKNSDGWGKINHYRLAIDSENPQKISISNLDADDLHNPNQILLVEVDDATSNVDRFRIKIDNEEPFEFERKTGSSTISLPTLETGYHSIIIEAFDLAGNSIVGTHSFTLESFDKPVFTDFPSEINGEVIPVIKGATRPNSQVEIFVKRVGGEPSVYLVSSDNSGNFIFIPEGVFGLGVYEISAQAKDEFGAMSERSDIMRIAVQQPGYLKIGSLIVSVLSVVIPLIVLTLASILGIWYLFLYSRKFRRKVKIESLEASEILLKEFSELQSVLRKQESEMQSSRKTNKLTKAETEMIRAMDMALQTSQKNVEKEISDITELAKRNK